MGKCCFHLKGFSLLDINNEHVYFNNIINFNEYILDVRDEEL
jgi:hypothetical protein